MTQSGTHTGREGRSEPTTATWSHPRAWRVVGSQPYIAYPNFRQKLFGKWLGGLHDASLVAQRGNEGASLLRLTDSSGLSLGLSGFSKQFLEGGFPETPIHSLECLCVRTGAMRVSEPSFLGNCAENYSCTEPSGIVVWLSE